MIPTSPPNRRKGSNDLDRERRGSPRRIRPRDRAMLLSTDTSAATKLDASQERPLLVSGCARDVGHWHCDAFLSTSAFARDSHGGCPHSFVKRQAVWLGVCSSVCIVAALVDYHFWQRTWWIWFGLVFIALSLCFVPHIGMRINGFVVLGCIRPGHISAVRNRQNRRGFFSCLVVRAS